MKTIPLIKKISFFLLFITIFSSSFAQTLEIVENQPDSPYFRAFETNNEDLVFTTHYGEINSRLYAFDGTNFQSLMLEEGIGSIWYLEEYQSKHYLTHFNNPAHLIEVDGSQVTLFEIPEDYDNPLFLGEYNDKLYVLGQGFEFSIFSFDGNELEGYEVPNELRVTNFYFSEDDQSIYLILKDYSTDEKTAWIFDGENYTEIPNPQGKEIIHVFGEINGVIAFWCRDAATYEIGSLYAYDGTNLTAFPNPENTSLIEPLGSNEEQLFLRYKNINTEKKDLYGFDGDNLNPLYTNPDKSIFDYEGNYNGKDYFRVFYDDRAYFHQYDGTSFTVIESPQGLSASYVPGLTDEKLFLSYVDNENNQILTKLSLGETTATLVPNPPVNMKLDSFFTQFENTFFYFYVSDSDPNVGKLYAVDKNGFKEVDTPENITSVSYAFTLNQEIFFVGYTEDPFTSQLYKINGSDLGKLEAVETNQNITVSPNPANDYFKIHFTNATIVGEVKVNIFSISGKLINTQDFRVSGSNPEIFYPTESLTSGVYVMEVTSAIGKATKKVIVE
tara:strand:+ start:4890 stop:6560 length:1671 start_codon:yes stop_codon:yes gene_type:complete